MELITSHKGLDIIGLCCKTVVKMVIDIGFANQSETFTDQNETFTDRNETFNDRNETFNDQNDVL